MDTSATVLKTFVDTETYPVLDWSQPQAQKKIDQWKDQLRLTGACVLPGFLRSDATKRFAQEANDLVPNSYWSELVGNAYLDNVDESLPATHARRLVDRTSLGVVAYDQFPKSNGLWQLYQCPEMTSFIAAIVGRGTLFHYGCPLGALNISVMKDNDYLRWHFDQADFVVSIPLQDALKGGDFEYVRHIRSKNDERYPEVAKVLNGERNGVEVLHMPPGSLILFEGRYTIHRVTTIHGKIPRLVALLGYDTKPDTDSSEYLKMIRYGRLAK